MEFYNKNMDVIRIRVKVANLQLSYPMDTCLQINVLRVALKHKNLLRSYFNVRAYTTDAETATNRMRFRDNDLFTRGRRFGGPLRQFVGRWQAKRERITTNAVATYRRLLTAVVVANGPSCGPSLFPVRISSLGRLKHVDVFVVTLMSLLLRSARCSAPRLTVWHIGSTGHSRLRPSTGKAIRRSLLTVYSFSLLSSRWVPWRVFMHRNAEHFYKQLIVSKNISKRRY